MNTNAKEKYKTEIKNLKNLKYSISDNTDILLDNFCDLDVTFFNKKFKFFIRHTY